jgi:hypothetical protein
MENKVGYLVEEKIDKDFTGYGTHTKERHFPKGNDDGTDGVNTRTYKGEYKNGKEHGIGMYSWSTGPKCVGEFVDDKVTGVAIKKWGGNIDEKYVGEFKNNEAEGFGCFIYPDGKRFIGQVSHDPTEDGTWYDRNGKQIT